MGHINTDSLVDKIHWSRALCLWDLFQTFGNVSDIRNLFIRLELAVLPKKFNGWPPLNIIAGWLCPTCVTGTWMTSWIDVILIWYHYILICKLVTIFNGSLSSKDMKLRVLIKEVLLVFHWLTFRIILLCSLVSGHRALFLLQETIR